MSVPFEKAVTEDLNLGHGQVTVTNPAGGTLVGNKINLGRILVPYVKTFSSTPAFDLADGDYQSITLTGNVSPTFTSSASGGLFEGAILILRVTQDGTGSRTWTWPSNVKGGSTAGAVSQTASAVSTITLIYDGTNFRFLAALTVS